MQSFLAELKTQRWDDHRYYHHSRINQSLHFLSAVSFIIAYITMFFDPVKSALIGWLVSMVSRQSGHFFFEPKGYDEVNAVTFERKEEIKVGFNLKRKTILFATWLSVPVALAACSVFGWISPFKSFADYLHLLGVLWLGLAAAGLLGRTLYLCITRNVQTGVVWFTKILTDPFHDVKIYHRAPLHLLRGEWFEPASHPSDHDAPPPGRAHGELRA